MRPQPQHPPGARVTPYQEPKIHCVHIANTPPPSGMSTRLAYQDRPVQESEWQVAIERFLVSGIAFLAQHDAPPDFPG